MEDKKINSMRKLKTKIRKWRKENMMNVKKNENKINGK